ncbi:50S ribosomal protein L32 [Desulfurobacterium indicum]|uniref:Large ribosomal subunit protein bL32 n=1 Tax=Desulfurobacterium indicum TaxID=1914305 RepID=A0A1R1MMH5_9BACT|nr:50S ribosomal protein L32 [Desulfurobacterium indicum]OMH40920.1 50S ribosomal protein L32 [Desulfurobacterium indicum]
MAVPKRRVSSTRRDKRRTHWKAAKPAISVCPNCYQPKLPHRVCKHCGYYNGKQVIEVEE